jgi:Icc protein
MDERGIRLLHLSDLHLGVDETIAGVSPGRRLAEVLGEVVDRRLAVDACVITGDLTDAGDPAGYRRLARLLGSCPWPVRVIPGNHDDIDVGRATMGDAYWPATDVWSWEIGGAAGPAGAVVIGVSTVVPGFNHGEVGAAALTEIDRLTAALGPDRPGARPWVLACHHPPVDVGHWWMDAQGVLAGADDLLRLARDGGALAVLCGHLHLTTGVWPRRGMPVRSAPSVVHEVVYDDGGERPLRFRDQPARGLLHDLRPDGLTTVELTFGGAPVLVGGGPWPDEVERTNRRGPVPR